MGCPGYIEKLTERELDVLQRLAAGERNREIGDSLCLAQKPWNTMSITFSGSLVRRTEPRQWWWPNALDSSCLSGPQRRKLQIAALTENRPQLRTSYAGGCRTWLQRGQAGQITYKAMWTDHAAIGWPRLSGAGRPEPQALVRRHKMVELVERPRGDKPLLSGSVASDHLVHPFLQPSDADFDEPANTNVLQLTVANQLIGAIAAQTQPSRGFLDGDEQALVGGAQGEWSLVTGFWRWVSGWRDVLTFDRQAGYGGPAAAHDRLAGICCRATTGVHNQKWRL